MVAAVDCAIIHSCDWDSHIPKARPFVEAGKAVLLDKPLAGNLADIEQIRHWSSSGARIAGGSSLLFAYDVQNWLALPVTERGQAHTVFCGCAVDDFNYGIHAFAMLTGLLGEGAVSVRHLNHHVQDLLQVQWQDGRTGLLCVGPAANWMPFYAMVVTERAPHTIVIRDASQLYSALLEAVLPYLAGETEKPPLPLETWLQPELCALAARYFRLHEGQEIRLDALPELLNGDDEGDAHGYDGSLFAQGYKAAKYPQAMPSRP
jgi:predicted dehydrogenase